MAILNEDLPFPVEELDNLKGAFVLTSAPDDTTNPPIMQRFWTERIAHAEIIEVPEGWGHLHGGTEEVWPEIFTRMMAGLSTTTKGGGEAGEG